ncbi:MAG: DNA primase [Marmoricola sp.]
MAGRIRDEDIAEVRERARIDDVVSQYVTLRSAGGGNLKGLCPFHDERSPSFNVTPSRGMYHCLAGETEVLTWDGIRPIRELAGGTHRILNKHARWVEAPFKSYGVQPLLKITLTRDRQVKEIFATDEHRWFVRASHVDERGVRVREAFTKELVRGDLLLAVAPGNDAARGTPPPWVVQSVEETDRVEEVFCAEVEDGHAFVLADNIVTGNCFGCGAGGDVIKFVMEMDGLGFTETVERLAEKAGVTLRYEEGGPARPSGGPQRPRLVEAHRLAGEYYADLLASPEAMPARQFLDQRGFDRDAAQTFGVGFSPRGGEQLLRHLQQKGFTDKELVASGLVGEGRGLYDRFRGRLMWPIRDTSGDTIGFGARRIFDDDRIEAKYLNTPETAIYKKSQVLYGIDLARREIARASQAVVVEGYTDVMACHLSGVKTAVATCGTAFGDDHARVIRRLLQDHDEFRGEVIFTFDGDEAGQKAALRAFEGDQIFAGQTYVAVEPSGLDPCDLRLKEGEAGVRELVARRVPLYRFVLANVVQRYDLDRADGRVDAVREAAKLVSAIRDRSKVEAFARELAGMVGVDPEEVRREVKRAAARAEAPSRPAGATPAAASPPVGAALPDPRDPRLLLERETLKLVVQRPDLVAGAMDDVDVNDFTHPAYAALWRVVAGLGGPARAADPWAHRLQATAEDPRLADLLTALAVEPVPSPREPTRAYAEQHVHRLRELTALRRIADLKSRLQRTNPVEHAAEYNKMFGELIALEQHRRQLRELATESVE